MSPPKSVWMSRRLCSVCRCYKISFYADPRDVRLLSELFHSTGRLGEAVVVVLRFIDFDSCPSTTPYKDHVW